MVDRDPVFRLVKGGADRYALSGVIDENVDLSFFSRMTGKVRLDLRGVRRINSFGVRAWIEAIRKVPPGVTLELTDCPPAVIDQINMVAGFIGDGQVTSFLAPMACERCGHEAEHLCTVAEYQRAHRLPDVTCPSCGAAMALDDLEEQYLLFAREPG